MNNKKLIVFFIILFSASYILTVGAVGFKLLTSMQTYSNEVGAKFRWQLQL